MRRGSITLIGTVGTFLVMAALPLNLQAQAVQGEVLECGEANPCTVQQMAEILNKDPGVRVRGIGPRAVAVAFPVNSSVVPRQHYPDLDKLGEALQSIPVRSRFQLEGHTDSDGNDRHNQVLSEKRAGSVKQYLVQRFAIEPERLSVVGYGASKPIAPNDTPEGKARNRRVQIARVP